MVSVVGIYHLVISVGDFAKSKEFYAPLMEFLGVNKSMDDFVGRPAH